MAGDRGLRGVFTIDEEYAYDNHPILFGQFTADSCVAACCKMLLEDEHIPEAKIRVFVKVIKDEGADIEDAPDALKRLDPSVSYTYHKKLSLDELRAATEKGPVMISIQTSIIGHGYHAVIVDGFEGQLVLIRDPLPELEGSAYKITLETFKRAWRGKAVILDQP